MNTDPSVYYRIEELIAAENAIGGVAYWTPILGSAGRGYWRSSIESEAVTTFEFVRDQGRNVRLVKVTEEVVARAKE